MNAEDLAVNDSAKDKKIEDLTASFPDRCITILLLTFFVETINLGDLAGLMITADKSHAIWVSATISEDLTHDGRNSCEPSL